MSKDSISDKLTELFELHKSGAITKEEFENLKQQMLLNNEAEAKNVEKKKQTHQIKKPRKPFPVRKVIGICLLVIGTILFLWSGYGLIKTATISKEKLEQRIVEYKQNDIEDKIISMERRGLADSLIGEAVDSMIDAELKKSEQIRQQTIVSSSITLLFSAGISFLGFKLSKKKKVV
jgi:Short C-terminal domain